MSNIGLENGLGVKGFVQIDIVNEESGAKQSFQYNTVTDLGKGFMLSRAASNLLMNPSGVSRGNLITVSTLGRVSSNTNMAYNAERDGLMLYLVNSDEVLSGASKLLPIYDSKKAIDMSKIIGYSGYNRVASTLKDGVLDYTKGSYLVDDTVVVQRWKFDLGQAEGTFNKICIGASVLNNPANGVALFKGLGGDLSYLATNKIETGYYARPGITGITSATEILVDSVEAEGYARAVIDLVTGEKTPLESTDARYGIMLGNPDTPQIVSGNWWIRRTLTGAKGRNLTTKAEQSRSGVSSGILFEYNGFVYTYNGSNEVLPFNIDTWNYDASKILQLSSMNIPSYMGTSFDYIGISSNNGKFYLSCRSTMNSDNAKGITIVCTDITNVGNSIIDILPRVYNNNVYTVNNEDIIIVDRVFPDMGYIKMGANNTVSPEYGLKIGKLKNIGNMLSYVNLTSPVTKTAGDVVYVSYGYKFV